MKMKLIFILTLGKNLLQYENEFQIEPKKRFSTGEGILLNDKQQYNTKRRAELLDYLRSMQGRHVTVSDIRAYFTAQGKTIGTATIYRQLENMLDQGLVNRYTLDETSAACYEYVGGGEHCQPTVCFHCKCVSCGALIHLRCEELEKVQGHLAAEHGFRLDLPRTVLYGLCRQCGGAQ